jgi:AraC-like DNA-binding protein
MVYDAKREKRIFRAWVKPRIETPFRPRGVGRGNCLAGTTRSELTMPISQLFWSHRGSGWSVYEGRKAPFGPGSLFVYYAGMSREVRAGNRDVEWRWLSLDGAGADRIFDAYGLVPGHIYQAGPPPLRLFDRLEVLLDSLEVQAERQALPVTLSILAEASGRIAREEFRRLRVDRSVARLRKLLEERHADPALSLVNLADDLNESHSLLTQRFHAAYGMPPKRYLSAIRFRKYNELTGAGLSRKDAALRCGFSSLDHLRQVLRTLGIQFGHRKSGSS